MAVYNISLGFVQLPDAQLEDKTNNVIANMTGNVNFTTPDPTLVAITAALGSFSSAVTAMNQTGKLGTIARDNTRGALIALLRQLVLYIEKTAMGDQAKLESSGFDVIGSDHPPVSLPKAVIAGIDYLAGGGVVLHCGAMGSALLLKVQHRLPGGAWVDDEPSTQARNVTVANLLSGTTYDFRVQFGAGNHNFGEWSDPVSHMAG